MAISEVVLETERLILSTWLPEQIDDLVLLHADEQVTKYLTEDGMSETRDQAQARLDLWADDFRQHRMGKLRLTLRSNGAFIGRAGFGMYEETNEPELGYALFPEYWGNGYALEVAFALRDWVFRDTPRDYFIGLADVRNTASLHILKRIGMVPTHIATNADDIKAQFFIFRRENWHG